MADVRRWLADPNGKQVYRLFGFAGTGKTTLARELAGDVGTVVYAAFTGKAALVLRSKGCDGASTIHSLIYKPKEERPGVITYVLNKLDSPLKTADLAVIDECSMVGEELAKDLLSFGVRVLVLGDPAQLPPVNGEGVFTNAKPDTMLTEVHRQARDNPIIRLSMDVREGRALRMGRFGDTTIMPRAKVDARDVLVADQVLVGMNKTRVTFNQKIRKHRGISDPGPIKDDKLVCLKNNKEKSLLNGGLWRVERRKKIGRAGMHSMILQSEDFDYLHAEVDVHPYFFLGREGELSPQEKKWTDQFTFGYALTVHKSQGSQWNNVMLFDESMTFREDARRWLYTGITRAAQKLTVVLGETK